MERLFETGKATNKNANQYGQRSVMNHLAGMNGIKPPPQGSWRPPFQPSITLI
jgi:hypothetical protein